MRRLAIVLAVALAAAFVITVPAQAAHTAARACTWGIDWDWHTSTAPNWSQVDWEWNNCGTWKIQQRSSCATRTGIDTVLSGIVTAIELEARATCTNTERLVACAYHIDKGSGWGSWVTDCNPPEPARGR